MSYQEIDLGAAPNDGSGDNARTGGSKINSQFKELFSRMFLLNGWMTTRYSYDPNALSFNAHKVNDIIEGWQDVAQTKWIRGRILTLPLDAEDPASVKVLFTSDGAVGVSTDADNSLSLGTDNRPYFKERTAEEIGSAYEGLTNTNKYTDADKAIVGNTSGTNTGDQDLSGKEDSLGNPATNGLVLSSTTGGIRSWVPMTSNPAEQSIVGDIENNASVNGTKNLALGSYAFFRYVLTGTTTLTESGTPAIGKTFVRNLLVTGNFALTYPASWTRKVGVYVGTKMNLITVSYANVGGSLFVDVVITQTN